MGGSGSRVWGTICSGGSGAASPHYASSSSPAARPTSAPRAPRSIPVRSAVPRSTSTETASSTPSPSSPRSSSTGSSFLRLAFRAASSPGRRSMSSSAPSPGTSSSFSSRASRSRNSTTPTTRSRRPGTTPGPSRSSIYGERSTAASAVKCSPPETRLRSALRRSPSRSSWHSPPRHPSGRVSLTS